MRPEFSEVVTAKLRETLNFPLKWGRVYFPTKPHQDLEEVKASTRAKDGATPTDVEDGVYFTWSTDDVLNWEDWNVGVIEVRDNIVTSAARFATGAYSDEDLLGFVGKHPSEVVYESEAHVHPGFFRNIYRKCPPLRPERPPTFGAEDERVVRVVYHPDYALELRLRSTDYTWVRVEYT